ncbi:MAG TPA: 8-amino-7-oxononanoate synthase [Gemmataceae bacterium]|jgi:8-amino-7-oxononanoate synthase|nr:8-amino-7-oxononanoate synthase [Gemmataceae bacterium]
MSVFDRWTSALDQLRAQGRFRQFALPSGIDFTSNDYLGYATKPNSIADDLPRSGIASRLLRGHHAIWEEVESSLADWHGAETVLMMTSGYTANEGLISTLMEPGDWAASDELNHACIVDGLRLARCRRFVFRHNDLNHLEDGLKAESAKNEPGRERFVITESLFSMDGDRAPLKEIAILCDRYGAYLIVDEAHSTGCYGSTGSGCVDAADVRDCLLASVHTGGKALALPGAYIAGSRLLKEYLINRCRHLIFTTAMPPAVGAWWKAGLARVQHDPESRERLHANAAFFRSELTRHAVAARGNEYVVPVVVGDDPRAVAAAARIREQGFDVRAIRPPSVPQGTARLRISIHADHEPPTLATLAAAIADALNHV